MEPESRPCWRELAIELYTNALLQAAELGAESLRRVKAQLARCDLFFLLTHVLGRGDLDRDWYFARCREVEAAPNGYLDLWGREHGKSSIITFGLTIQDILNNPEIISLLSNSTLICRRNAFAIGREYEKIPTVIIEPTSAGQPCRGNGLRAPCCHRRQSSRYAGGNFSYCSTPYSR
jgi:hypothetical protein